MFFLIESITLLKISLILMGLLSKSKHLKMLTQPLLHHKIIVRERVIYDPILLWMGWVIHGLPQKLTWLKDTFIPGFEEDLELLPVESLILPFFELS